MNLKQFVKTLMPPQFEATGDGWFTGLTGLDFKQLEKANENWVERIDTNSDTPGMVKVGIVLKHPTLYHMLYPVALFVAQEFLDRWVKFHKPAGIYYMIEYAWEANR